MKKRVLFSILLFLYQLPVQGQAVLFPTPAIAKNLKGSFAVSDAIRISGNGGYADSLAKKLQIELTDFRVQPTSGAGEIRLILDKSPGMSDNAYSLEVTPESITLQASDKDGLFYAREALLQLARPESSGRLLHPGRY